MIESIYKFRHSKLISPYNDEKLSCISDKDQIVESLIASNKAKKHIIGLRIVKTSQNGGKRFYMDNLPYSIIMEEPVLNFKKMEIYVANTSVNIVRSKLQYGIATFYDGIEVIKTSRTIMDTVSFHEYPENAIAIVGIPKDSIVFECKMGENVKVVTDNIVYLNFIRLPYFLTVKKQSEKEIMSSISFFENTLNNELNNLVYDQIMKEELWKKTDNC